MATSLKEEAQSWRLGPDGDYTRVSTDPSAPSAHVYFMTNPSLSGRGSALQSQRVRSSPRLVTERDSP